MLPGQARAEMASHPYARRFNRWLTEQIVDAPPSLRT